MFKAYQDFEKRGQKQFFKSVLIDTVTIKFAAALYFHVDQSLYSQISVISQTALAKMDTLLSPRTYRN